VTGSGGRDRRAVRHVAPAGALDTSVLPVRPHVVVTGGGIAGLAAATGLAERGVRVTLVEREPYLGGRVGGWTEPSPAGDQGGLAMSRGFHAFFRQYYNLRALLRRADPRLARLVPLTDYPLVDAEGRRDTFRGLPRTPPWNALAFALRSPTFRPRDLMALNTAAAAPLAAVSVPGVYDQLDQVDAETFLREINFPATARHLAFEVFSRSFFAAPDEMSAAELAAMFHIYFLGSSEGLVFDVPDAGFDVALWDPLQRYLAARDVEVRTGTDVTGIEPGGPRRYRVHTPGGPLDADAVVLATDVGGLRAIVARSPGLDDPAWRDQVGGLRTAPPFLVQRLWLDRPVDPDRTAFLATGGLDPLDNISVLDRYDSQARSWAAAHGGSVVELHAYAAPGDPAVPPDPALLRRTVARLHDLYPETAAARVLAESVQWRADCPMFGVGDFSRRPRVRTPFPGLVLAGDGIRIDLPVALMERAASTGWHAANCLLARWGLAGHELYTVPTRGRMAGLRWLATHARAHTNPQAPARTDPQPRQLGRPPQSPEPGQPLQSAQPPQPHQSNQPHQPPWPHESPTPFEGMHR
jgi:isorenieratene synthase